MNKGSLMPIESLESALRQRFPEAQISLDRPRKAAGVWFLDLVQAGHLVTVQWQLGHGFGMTSTPNPAYGERADEVYQDEEAAYGRIVSLVLSRTFTAPPPTVSLKELRKESGLSQAELAVVLNRQQGEISKIERRKDVLVSTLTDYVKAVDGDLQIIVRLKDGRIRRVQLEETLAEPPPQTEAISR